MKGRRSLLSPAVRTALIEAIEGGAFDWVAAEAAGISRRTFYDWMKRGEAGEEPFAELVGVLRRARATARVGAERTVRLRDPLAWLRLGPGRERPEEPGWTLPPKPAAPGGAEESEAERVLRAAQEEVREPGVAGGAEVADRSDDWWRSEE
jgi:hypothetical protein